MEEGSDGSSDIEFEELIEQNKEILKNNKQKGEPRQGSESVPQKKPTKRKSKTIKTYLKNDNSIYQKKMKEYRDGPLENKYLQRKKEMLVQRQEAVDRIAEKNKAKQRQNSPLKETREKAKDTPPREKVHLANFSSNKSVPRPQPPRSAFKQKKSMKNLTKEDPRPSKMQPDDQKSANLFDNIHNLLLNPQKSRAKSEVKRS